MKLLGALVMAIGAAICAFAWSKMPVTAGEVELGGGSTLNIGLLQDQHMIWEGGLAVLIVGALFVAAGVIAGAVRE